MKKIYHLLVVTLIISILSIQFAEAQWEKCKGPYGGTFLSFAFKDKKVFAGSSDGGVFISADSGATWNSSSNGLNNFTIKALTVRDNNIYAGTYGGVYLSSNNGDSWKLFSDSIRYPIITSITTDNDKIYAGTYYQGIYSLSKTGKYWEIVKTEPSQVTALSQITSLVTFEDILFATTLGNTVFKYSKSKLTTFTLPCTYTLAMIKHDKYLFAGTNKGIVLSSDTGKTWNLSNTGLNDSLLIVSIAERGDDILASAGNKGVYISTDNGASWSLINKGLDSSAVQVIAAKDSIFYAGSVSNGIYLTKDNGENWQQSNQGLSGEYIFTVTQNGNNLYACTSGEGIFTTTDKGDSWTKLNKGFGSLNITSLIFNDTDYLAGTYGDGIYLSKDKGANWGKISNGLPSDSSNGYVLAPIMNIVENGNKIFAATLHKGIYVTSDTGKSWTASNSGLTNQNVYTIISKKTQLYAATDAGVFVSTNNGQKWTSLSTGFPSTPSVPALAAYKNNLFASVWGSGVYSFDSVQKKWFAVNVGIATTYINCFVIKDTILLAGTDNGIYIYNDKSKTWADGNSGMILKNITSLSITDSILFAGTSGLSVWKRKLSQIIPMIYNTSFNYLDINNVKARINANGNHFWDPMSGASEYEVPKGSGKMSIFTEGLWVAAKDNNHKLHFAGERYRSKGADFYQGPIMATDNYEKQAEKWNTLWKVNKSEIDAHKANWTEPSYKIPPSLIYWPANGNKSLGQAEKLAPYYDNDNDGIYDASKGDYPIIRGDQAIYFMINDDNLHTESGGEKLGIEVHGMAYAFNKPLDSAMNNTIFINYQIINRSVNKYDSVFIGAFNDFDIGDGWDDYIGCDTLLNSYYGYNSAIIDGSGQPYAYGLHPPAQSVTILNTKMYSFTDFVNSNNPNLGDPSNDIESFNYMQGKWRNGQQLLTGGNGYSGTGVTNKPTNYIYPGDPADKTQWSEVSINSTKGDRRGVGSVGPLTLDASEIKCIDLAFVNARDYKGNNITSVTLLKQRIASIQNYYNTYINGDCFDLTKEVHPINAEDNTVFIYPNPIESQLNIIISEKGSNKNKEKNYKIYNLTGSLVGEGKLVSGTNKISVGELNKGMYIISIKDGSKIINRKIIKK